MSDEIRGLSGAGYSGRSTKEMKTERAAREFHVRPELEKAIEIRDSDPAAYARLSPGVKVQIGYYEAAKRAAAEFEGGAA